MIRTATADRCVFALLQHPQKARLRLQWHISDLVEKKRSAFGLFKAADAAIGGAGKRAAFMPKEFALHELFGNRRHVHRHEGPMTPPAIVMQGTRDQFLAGPALAHNHHGEIGLGKAGNYAIDFLHRGGAPDQRQSLLACL
jgi:hypothetical protein